MAKQFAALPVGFSQGIAVPLAVFGLGDTYDAAIDDAREQVRDIGAVFDVVEITPAAARQVRRCGGDAVTLSFSRRLISLIGEGL